MALHAHAWNWAPPERRWRRSQTCTGCCLSKDFGEALRVFSTSAAPPATPAQRQLSIAFESPMLRDLDPSERNRVVLKLALLLMEAAGVPAAGSGHDER